jgi:hypothetical protein
MARETRRYDIKLYHHRFFGSFLISDVAPGLSPAPP